MAAAWFRRKDTDGAARTRVVTEGLWIKCDSCKEIIYRAEVERGGRVCPKCHYPFRISARERISQLAYRDGGRFDCVHVSSVRASIARVYRNDTRRAYNRRQSLRGA